jgi:mRNA interferase RelE/StbE
VRYDIEYKPQAWRDLDDLPVKDAIRIETRITKMRNDLVGDVKRLHNFTPSYRLRVGDYRVLFEVEGDTLVVYRVKHRREAYD